MKNHQLKRLVLAAMFLAMGMLFPLLTGQIKEIGDTLLPMHIPVMLCGIFCGLQYGSAVGLVLPFIRSAVFGMPPVFPNAVWMSLELATYGFVIGFLYSKIRKKSIGTLYLCLITSMIAGRAVWGISKVILLGISGNPFTFKAFIVGGILDALPGIVLQLILIPITVRIADRQNFISHNS